MIRALLVTTAVTIGSAVALAGSGVDKGLSGAVMDDHPGTTGQGNTKNPTARPDNDAPGLQRKAMKDHPGTKSGTTKNPTAKPDQNSLSGETMKDHPGVN